jgi:rubredoxin
VTNPIPTGSNNPPDDWPEVASLADRGAYEDSHGAIEAPPRPHRDWVVGGSPPWDFPYQHTFTCERCQHLYYDSWPGETVCDNCSGTGLDLPSSHSLPNAAGTLPRDRRLLHLWPTRRRK